MKTIPFIVLVALSLISRIGYAEQAPGSFAYVLQADSFAKTKTLAVAKLAACGRDWIILDAVFDGETAWDRADLDALRRGRSGRKVLAYLSIGEAENYRAYWSKEWVSRGKPTPAAPTWLGAENPEWAGNYRVKYWNAAWQKLMLTAIDDAMARGFDGVYLDIVDGFETFERNGTEYIDDRLNPDTMQSYRRDMVDWVKEIAARVRAKMSSALVVPQNGSQLLAHADFRNGSIASWRIRRDRSTEALMKEPDQEDLAEFEIPDFREITENGDRLLIEVTVKSNGVWVIHKSDPDTNFPSDFHADRRDAAEKLDLYTGNVFDRTNRQMIRKFPRKAMLLVFRRLLASKEPEIQSKLAQRERFCFLS
jgi:cysteinyl-tRNA synthetase